MKSLSAPACHTRRPDRSPGGPEHSSTRAGRVGIAAKPDDGPVGPTETGGPVRVPGMPTASIRTDEDGPVCAGRAEISGASPGSPPGMSPGSRTATAAYSGVRNVTDGSGPAQFGRSRSCRDRETSEHHWQQSLEKSHPRVRRCSRGNNASKPTHRHATGEHRGARGTMAALDDRRGHDRTGLARLDRRPRQYRDDPTQPVRPRDPACGRVGTAGRRDPRPAEDSRRDPVPGAGDIRPGAVNGIGPADRTSRQHRTDLQQSIRQRRLPPVRGPVARDPGRPRADDRRLR